MFTPEEREEIRARLVARARDDDRVTCAALTGSAALGTEDRWSDVDVFLGVRGSIEDVMADWTDALGAIHHWDLPAGQATYRVFLLDNGLQVDIAFTPEADFGARAPSFQVLFGDPVDIQPPEPPSFDEAAGMGWLSVLHAFTRIERGRLWEAAYWIASARDQTLTLACLRYGESPVYARGVDRLPTNVTGPLAETFVASPEPDELRRALRAARRCLIDEIGQTDPVLSHQLEAALPR